MCSVSTLKWRDQSLPSSPHNKRPGLFSFSFSLYCNMNPFHFHVVPFPQQMSSMLCHTLMLIQPHPILTRSMLHTASCPSISLLIILHLLRTSSPAITLICEIFSVIHSHPRLALALRSPAQSYISSTVSMSKPHQWISTGV